MRIQDIQSAEAELSFHWRLMPLTRKQRRGFVISFLETMEAADGKTVLESELRDEFMRRSRERMNPVIWFMLAQFVWSILVEWWKTRDPA